VTVLLTEEHLRKITEYDLLKEAEISDPVKLSRVVRKSLDAALELPDLLWHDWDEWGRGCWSRGSGPDIIWTGFDCQNRMKIFYEFGQFCVSTCVFLEPKEMDMPKGQQRSNREAKKPKKKKIKVIAAAPNQKGPAWQPTFADGKKK